MPTEKQKLAYLKSLKDLYFEWTLMLRDKKGRVKVIPELVIYDFLRLVGMHDDTSFQYVTGKSKLDCTYLPID